MTGSAFAAASLNAGNTTLAAELISPSTDYSMATVNTAYQPAGAVAASTRLRFSLTNATFDAGAVLQMCAAGTNVSATYTVLTAPNNTFADFILNKPLASGDVYTLSNTNDNCVTAPVALTNVNILAGSAAGATASIAITNKDNSADPNVLAEGTIATVSNQFSATLSAVTSKLDFADNQETFRLTGTALPYTPAATQSQAGLLIVSNLSLANTVTTVDAGGACNKQLVAGDTVRIKITGDLTGISNIKYGTVPQSYTITSVDKTNGYATFNLAGNTTQMCAATETATKRAVELTAANVTGTPIVAGTRTVQVILLGGGNVAIGYSRDLVAAGTSSHIIQLDATQYYIPLIKVVAPSTQTYIKLQSKTTLSGSGGVSFSILASDGTTVTYNAGSITPGTPKTVTGSDLEAAVTAAGKTVDGSAGFAAVVTINVPEADLFVYANTIDAAGQWKRIPVKTVSGAIAE